MCPECQEWQRRHENLQRTLFEALKQRDALLAKVDKLNEIIDAIPPGQ